MKICIMIHNPQYNQETDWYINDIDSEERVYKEFLAREVLVEGNHYRICDGYSFTFAFDTAIYVCPEQEYRKFRKESNWRKIV